MNKRVVGTPAALALEPARVDPVDGRVVWIVTGTRRQYPGFSEHLAGAAMAFGRPAEIHLGDATGVDYHTREWAKRNGIFPVEYEAYWKKYGPGAGPRRNQRVVDGALLSASKLGLPVICFAYPDRQSTGTWDCVRRAADAGVGVCVTPVGALSYDHR